MKVFWILIIRCLPVDLSKLDFQLPDHFAC
jgi:hypothetical protein